MREQSGIALPQGTGPAFDRLFDETSVGLQINAPTGHYQRVNRAFADLVGYEPEELVGRGWWEISFDEESDRADAIRRRLWRRQTTSYRQVKRYLTKDGRVVWGAISVVPIFASRADPEPEYVLTTVIDVTDEMHTTADLARTKRELLASEQRFHALLGRWAREQQPSGDRSEDPAVDPAVFATSALVDPVTGVASTEAIHDRLRFVIDGLGRRSNRGVAVAVLDVEDGPLDAEVSAEVERRVAQEIRALLRPQDSIGRLEGSRFLVVLDGPESPGAAEAMIDRVLEAASPVVVEVGASSAYVAVTAGLAWSELGAAPADLIAQADRNLVERRRTMPLAGTGRDEGTDNPSTRDAHLHSHRISMREISTAVDRREFVLHYQPIYDTRRRVVAVEALLRWQHPSRGLLFPVDFLDDLLHSGHIAEVGGHVVELACGQLSDWDAAGVADLQMHVNVSPAELAHPNFGTMLRAAIHRFEIDPVRLVVEVTEVSLDGSLVSEARLREISQSGARLVLDDFGTGVSSLSHLRTDSLHGVKIDRSFVSGTSVDGRDRRIARGVVGLAHEVGIEVTAEGVETGAQAQWIVETGCDQMQGWFFSRAVPAEQIPELVSRSPGPPT